MDAINKLFLDLLCISIPIGILVISAILGIRVRIKSAGEMRNKLNSGHYARWLIPASTNRLRMIAGIQITILLGMLSIFVIWLKYPNQELRTSLICVFGIILLVMVILEIIKARLLKDK